MHHKTAARNRDQYFLISLKPLMIAALFLPFCPEGGATGTQLQWVQGAVHPTACRLSALSSESGTAALISDWGTHRVVHGVLLSGKEDFFIQTALPEQALCSAAPKDDEAGAVEWQQGFKVFIPGSAAPRYVCYLC